MNLMPKKRMTDDECRMEEAHHSSIVNRHSAQQTEQRASKIIFGVNSIHCQQPSAPNGRRSPGRRALFSSFHPASASWTAKAGFTLIEVLLALMISALVLVVIGSVFAGALHLQSRASANLDESLPIERALTLLRRDLKNAVAPGGMLAGPLQSGSLQGGVDANNGIQIFTTTGLITPNSPWAEIQKVTYGLQTPNDATGAGAKDLVRTVTRNLLSTTTQDEEDQFLASGVESLNFSYFDGANWLDTWDDTTQTNLPIAVRVSLQMATKDSAQTRPDPIQLLVPLMVQVHTNELDNSDSGSTNSAAGGGP
jgi:type II secretion system protein J